MLIKTRLEMMDMPVGTLYHEYQPDMCHGTLNKIVERRMPMFSDWYYIEVTAGDKDGPNSSVGGDGMYASDDLIYAVYEDQDVRQMLLNLGAPHCVEKVKE